VVVPVRHGVPRPGATLHGADHPVAGRDIPGFNGRGARCEASGGVRAVPRDTEAFPASSRVTGAPPTLGLEALNKLGCGGPPRSARAGRASSGGLAFPARAQTGAGERDVQILFECSADVPILGMEIPDPKGLKPAFNLDLFEGPYAPLWTSRSLVCARPARGRAQRAR
jgi:hypothetical protein